MTNESRNSFYLLVLLLSCNATVAQPVWEKTNGPYAFPVIGLYADSTRLVSSTYIDDTLLEEIMQISFSNGDHWESTRIAPAGAGVITFDKSGRMYLGYFGHSNDVILWGGNLDELWEDWIQIEDAEFASKFLWENSDSLLISTGIGIFRAAAGHLAESKRIAFPDTTVFDMLLPAKGNLWAATEFGLYQSLDDGVSWTRRLDQNRLTSLALLTVEPEYLIVGTYDDGVFLSDDGGSTWIPSVLWPGYTVSKILPYNGNIIAGTDRGVLYSPDVGQTWVDTNLPEYVYQLAEANGYVFAGTSRGLHRSEDSGKTWYIVGAPGSNINALYFDEERGRLLAGDNHWGVSYTDDRGKSWHASNLRSANIGSFVPLHKDGEIVAYPVFWGPSFITRDSGETWERYQEDRFLWYVHPDRSLILAPDDSGSLVWSFDEGATWVVIPEDGLENRVLRFVVGSDKTLWAYGDSALYNVKPGSDRWQKALDCGSSCYARDLKLVTGPDGAVCLSEYPRTSCSQDSGATWTYHYNKWIVAITEEGHLLTGTEISRDGATWEPFSDGLPRYATADPMVFTEDGYAFAATQDYEVYKSVLPVTTDLEQFNQPVGTDRSINAVLYPNPVDDVLFLKYTLPAENLVSVAVFDILGRTVKRVVNQEWRPGSESIEKITLGSLPAGYYVVRISGGDTVITRPFVKVNAD